MNTRPDPAQWLEEHNVGTAAKAEPAKSGGPPEGHPLAGQLAGCTVRDLQVICLAEMTVRGDDLDEVLLLTAELVSGGALARTPVATSLLGMHPQYRALDIAVAREQTETQLTIAMMAIVAAEPADRPRAPAEPAWDETTATAVEQLVTLGHGFECQEAAAAAAAAVRDTGECGAFTDALMAERVAAELLAGRYCWAYGLGWLTWDAARWRRAPDKEVLEAIRGWAADRFREAVAAAPADAIAEIMKTWGTMLAAGKLSAVQRLAAGIVLRDAREFDADPDVINTPAGVVSLVTGEVTPAAPGQLFTKVTRARYVPGARHPDWDQALEALPSDVREYVQIRMGQAATGHPPSDDVLTVLNGTGENGKTSQLAGIGRALGDYYVLVSQRVLLGSPDDHPTELMDFLGARMAVIEETPEEGRLSVAGLKRVVGTPQITARYCRQDNITFDVTHSQFLSSNYLPVVNETDHGTWRRLECVGYPFRWRKPGEPLTGPDDRHGDPGLRGRLIAGADGQHEAILAWLVEGAIKWYAAGRVMPPVPARIQRDTRAWRKTSDLILAYTDDRLVFDADCHVMSSELFGDFTAWLTGRGYHRWTDRTFAARFGSHDEVTGANVRKLVVRHSSAGMLSRPELVNPAEAVPERYHAWHGIRFRTSTDDRDEPEEGDEGDKLTGGTAGTALPLNRAIRVESCSTGEAVPAVPVVTPLTSHDAETPAIAASGSSRASSTPVPCPPCSAEVPGPSRETTEAVLSGNGTPGIPGAPQRRIPGLPRRAPGHPQAGCQRSRP